MFSINMPGFFLFVLVLLIAWYLTPQNKRWLVMLVANVVFYVSISAVGIFVLLACSAVVWWSARRSQRHAWLYVGLAASLGPLLVYRFVGLAGATGISSFVLPQLLGLAYFTLQLAGYLFDVNAGRIEAEKSFLRVFCYASLFLSITQGPFNRYSELMPQLDCGPKFDAQRIRHGALRCVWGFFKKLAIAERIAIPVNTAFTNPVGLDSSQLAFAATCFTLQLYADFSGYSDIVLGVGEMLGLQLPENFRQPLFASSIKEFWGRWHISLSRWFRDYVYIPLGGNRKGGVRRDWNVFLTMLVSGFWHGANWTFLLWGGVHGMAQAAENHLPGTKKQAPPVRVMRTLLTFVLVVLLFTVFNTTSLAASVTYFSEMLGNPGFGVFAKYWELGLTSRTELLFLLAGIAVMLLVDVVHEKGVSLRDWVTAQKLPVRWLVYQAAIFAFLFMGRFITGASGTFLYAKF